jgi:hypothetical protein
VQKFSNPRIFASNGRWIWWQVVGDAGGLAWDCWRREDWHSGAELLAKSPIGAAYAFFVQII